MARIAGSFPVRTASVAARGSRAAPPPGSGPPPRSRGSPRRSGARRPTPATQPAHCRCTGAFRRASDERRTRSPNPRPKNVRWSRATWVRGSRISANVEWTSSPTARSPRGRLLVQPAQPPLRPKEGNGRRRAVSLDPVDRVNVPVQGNAPDKRERPKSEAPVRGFLGHAPPPRCGVRHGDDRRRGRSHGHPSSWGRRSSGADLCR